MTVPYSFGAATSAIPLSQLDANFNTPITLGNTAIQLGNTVTTLNNMTLANVTISSGNVTITNVTVTTANATTVNTTTLIATTANVTTGNVTNLISGNVSLTGGSITGTPISGSTGSFTTLTTSSTVTLNGGLANAVQYLDGSKVLSSDANFVYNTTGLGIGTSSPAMKLDVRVSNSAFLQGALNLSNSVNSDFSIQLSSSVAQIGTGTSTPIVFATGNAERMRLDSSGNLGIGTSSPSQKLTVAGNIIVAAGANERVYFNTANNTTDHAGYVGRNTSDGFLELSSQTLGTGFGMRFLTAGSTRMTLDSSGNLGLGVTPSGWNIGKAMQIGTAGDLSLLGFSNSAYLGANTYYNGGWVYAATAAAGRYQINSGAHSWYTAPSGIAGNAISFTQAMTLDASGNLLVGTTTSQDPLTVNGGATLNGGLDFSTSGTKNWQVVGNATDFYIGDQTLTRYAQLQGITTFTAWTFVSDRRLKHQIKDLHYGLDSLMQIRPREFNFIKDDQFSIGFIAQELKEVIPEAVTGNEIEFADNDSPEERASKTMGVSKETLIPVLVKAIQELKAEFDAYKATHP